jgi:hypothetical protein
MQATVIFVEHADGSAEPLIARAPDRASVRDAVTSAGLSPWCPAFRTTDGTPSGSWLRSTHEGGDEPVQPAEVPEKIRQYLGAIGTWRPTHRLYVGGVWRYVSAPSGDGPAPTLREHVAPGHDGHAEPELSFRGGRWFHFATPFEGQVELASPPSRANPETKTQPSALPGASEPVRRELPGAEPPATTQATAPTAPDPLPTGEPSAAPAAVGARRR